VLDFRILGPLEVARDGAVLAITAPKQRTTLAVLLLSANRVVSVDTLAEALYGDAPPVTAVTQVQRQISDLRKALGDDATIETRPPGYVLRVQPSQLDLARFERLADEAQRLRVRGDTHGAAELLREALALWRGPALADLGYESFARAPIERLEEIRLEALEQRIEAELALGRHGPLVSELEALVVEHPLHERFAAQLMLALYRAGRQADALAANRRLRDALVEELGLEPTRALRELEQAILRQDSSLDAPGAPGVSLRSVLAVTTDDARVEDLLGLALPLATPPDREVILVRLVTAEGDVRSGADALNARRSTLAPSVRAAAFASDDVTADVLRLTSAYDVHLVLLDALDGLGEPRLPDAVAALLDGSPADVAFVRPGTRSSGDVFVAFGGSEHDWAAAELGAWLAQGLGAQLVLVGTKADPSRGRRDASRLLADAALAVQRVAGVDTAPLLADPTEAGLVAGVADAAVVVVGIGDRWRREGLGTTRRALFAAATQPLLIVHRGLRPGGLAPGEAGTRFTWTAAPQAYLQAVSIAPT
jgi:DNA-binding SARP family transcriptional activator